MKLGLQRKFGLAEYADRLILDCLDANFSLPTLVN